MNQGINEKISASIQTFNLPDYQSIPDVGLYLEQTVRYISDCLSPLSSISITGSMVANYVKKDLIDNPVKKQYSREQIAYLIFIAVAKTVLSLEDIQLLIKLQKKTYTAQRAYEYFAREFINILYFVFGLKETLDEIGVDNTDEKTMLRNTIITVAHKIHLDKCFEANRATVD
ncbi:MAG: DUF1836 domain-containing protein [Clostridia bacterium]|nr:DUF1836 domain-containing protein [Clostridia bacterium]